MQQQAYPGTRQAYPGTRQAYPGTQQVYPGTQQVYPGTQQAYPGTQQAYPGTQQAYPGTRQPPTVVVGAPRQPMVIAQGEKPNDHRPMILFTLLCCCMPVSLGALHYCHKVNSLWEAGDREGAEAASRKAGMLWKVSIGLGLPTIAIVLLVYFLVINPI